MLKVMHVLADALEDVQDRLQAILAGSCHPVLYDTAPIRGPGSRPQCPPPLAHFINCFGVEGSGIHLLWILADGRKRLPMHMRCRRQVLEITNVEEAVCVYYSLTKRQKGA